jgi:hypothetical protein
MSDVTKVSCRLHGESHATFVCQHLVRGFGKGFYCALGPDDERPDAWCGDCEKVFQQEGEWNDRSEGFAKIKLLCAGCYDVVKKRNELRTDYQDFKGFTCATCGEYHDQLLMDFGYNEPLLCSQIPVSEKSSRCFCNPDLCVVDEEYFFIRSCLEIPVWGCARPFVWGVWASLSKENFRRAFKLWDDPKRIEEPPYFGWLSSALPTQIYPNTLHLKTHVHTRSMTERPYIELEATDNPLAVDQRDGITLERVLEIIQILHRSAEES